MINIELKAAEELLALAEAALIEKAKKAEPLNDTAYLIEELNNAINKR